MNNLFTISIYLYISTNLHFTFSRQEDGVLDDQSYFVVGVLRSMDLSGLQNGSRFVLFKRNSKNRAYIKRAGYSSFICVLMIILEKKLRENEICRHICIRFKRNTWMKLLFYMLRILTSLPLIQFSVTALYKKSWRTSYCLFERWYCCSRYIYIYYAQVLNFHNKSSCFSSDI